MPIINEDEISEKQYPGRSMRWLVTPEVMGVTHLSMCVIKVPVGETVKPAHSHPQEEEVIYIIRGEGRVFIDGKVGNVKEGSAVLFPQNAVHMLRNTGNEEMKVACFFAPPSDVSTYQFFEDIMFPE